MRWKRLKLGSQLSGAAKFISNLRTNEWAGILATYDTFHRALKSSRPKLRTAMAAHSSGIAEFQILSDLHLETPRFLPMYGEFAVTARSPYLALLGDIGNSHDDRLYDFLERQLQRFKIVFFVIGNHEPYFFVVAGLVLCSYEAAVAKMQAFEASIAFRQSSSSGHDGGNRAPGRFVLLNRRRFDISDQVTVLGCTLFSRICVVLLCLAVLFVFVFSFFFVW